MDPAEGRSAANLTRSLKGIVFPAGRDDLVRGARENGAGEDVIEALTSLEDREYDSIADVMRSFSKAA